MEFISKVILYVFPENVLFLSLKVFFFLFSYDVVTSDVIPRTPPPPEWCRDAHEYTAI